MTRIDIPVAVDIESQRPHRMDGNTVIGRPARIVRIVDIATLAGDDFFCNGTNRQHGPTSHALIA